MLKISGEGPLMTELKTRSSLYLMAWDYDRGEAHDRWVEIKDSWNFHVARFIWQKKLELQFAKHGLQ